jgi:hypothetical protein
VNAVSRRCDVLIVEQDAAALETGDSNVRLPGKLAECGLVTTDNALLQFVGLEWLDTANTRVAAAEAVNTVELLTVGLQLLLMASVRVQLLLLSGKILVLIELLLRHDVR